MINVTISNQLSSLKIRDELILNYKIMTFSLKNGFIRKLEPDLIISIVNRGVM